MSSAGESNVSRPQSVFISYASDDRPAVRALRDALTQTGLEVWFDENELGGGDAWDQKIRRQIRECDYFMPVISAATERRKEGYFRREWRIAVERTMDMADDVLFLVPVVIDETSESHARVPDKFLSVQWLRVPSAVPTDALQLLARRMLAGDHRPPPLLTRTNTRSPESPNASGSRPSQPSQPAQLPQPPNAAEAHQPLPMPPFPHGPAKDSGFAGGLKFFAEIIWWCANTIRFVAGRLPKFVRVILVVWLVILFVSRWGKTGSSDRSSDRFSDRPSPAQIAEVMRAHKKALESLPAEFRKTKTERNKSASPDESNKSGQRSIRTSTAGAIDAADKQLVLVPFTNATATEDAEVKSLQTIFASLYGKLKLANSNEVGVLQEPMPDFSRMTLLEQGKTLGCDFMLHVISTDSHVLNLELLNVSKGQSAWTGSYPLTNADAAAIAEQIASGVLAVLPKK